HGVRKRCGIWRVPLCRRPNFFQRPGKTKERRKSIDHKGQWWLRVGRSGLKWTLIPPAHGDDRLSSNLLRRPISSRHRRKKSRHHPLTLATQRRRGIYSPARFPKSFPSCHVAGGICPHERG